MNRRKGVPCGCDAEPCGCSPKNHCVKAINNASPDPNGDFTIVAGDNVTITETQYGIEIEAAGGISTVNGQYPDSQGNVSVNVGVLTVNGDTPDAQGNVDVSSMEFVAQGNVEVYFATLGHTPYVSQRITVTLPSSAGDMVSGYDYLVTASVLDMDNFQPVDDVTISLPYGNLVTPTNSFVIDVNGGEDIIVYWTVYRMKVTHTGLTKIFGALPSSVTDQEKLVSGTNIKTINSGSLLGSGNINLQTPLTAGIDYQTPLVAGTDYQVPLVSGTNIKTINNESLLGSGDIQIGGGGLEWTLRTVNNDWTDMFALNENSKLYAKKHVYIYYINHMAAYIPKGFTAAGITITLPYSGSSATTNKVTINDYIEINNTNMVSGQTAIRLHDVTLTYTTDGSTITVSRSAGNGTITKSWFTIYTAD